MIFFDNIIFSLQKAGGISVVWSEILRGISESRLEYKCLEYNYSESNIFRKDLSIPSNKVIYEDYPFLSIQRYFKPKLNIIDDQAYIFHSSYYRYCPNKKAINFTTVHDFTYEYYSKGVKKYLHSFQKNKAIRNSQYIICISETTKKDLLRFLPDVEEEKIHVIYNGVSADYFPLEMNEINPLYGDFVVFVGARRGYKNFNIAVSAIKKTNLNLVIVGNKLSKKEYNFLLEQLGDKRFFDLGRISNEKLNLIYNQAYCLLYPSSYEGFGIPVIEAQKSGCPVVVVNAPSIVEIIGDTTLVADNEVKSLVQKMELLQQPLIREFVIRKGLNNALNYSWDKMMEQLLELYKRALKNNI